MDIRSDIYSLGVLLYELLTGTTPFERQRFATAAYEEIRRIIKEEEPPKPSTRLSTLGEALSAVSARRKTEPAKLSALVRGDLDWIVMKALEKERSRRYETASAFAADVRRFLNQEPIEARPPSAWYRFGKLARRNKVALTTAALIAAALILGTGASTWQALRATAAEGDARRSEGVAQEKKREANEAKERAEKQRDELAALNERLRLTNYIADMNLAQHAWEDNNLARVGELLDRHRPRPGQADLRCFEWHYLRGQFHRDRLTVKAHGGDAMMVAYTPDGKRLVSYGTARPPRAGQSHGSLRGELKRCDAATGEAHPLPLKGPVDKAICAALSPDGKRLAAGCRDKIIRVWDVDMGELFTLEGHAQGNFFRVSFSHDGKRLVSLANDFAQAPLGLGSEIKVWDLTTRKAIVSLEIPYTLSLAISPDGNLVAAGPFDSSVVRLWDTTTGRELPSLKDAGVCAYAMAFSPEGKRLATSGMNDVKIWDVATGKILVTCQGASEESVGSTFSPDGKRLATTTWRGLVELWDAATGRKVRTFKGHAGTVWSVAFSPDGTQLASAGLGDGTLKVWDTRGEPDAIAIPVSRRIFMAAVLLSPDGRTVLTGYGEKAVRLWDAETGKRRGVTIKCPHPIIHFDVTPDCKRMAVAGTGNQVTIWDLKSGKAVRTIRSGAEPVTDAAISPDGKLLAVLGKGRAIRLWDIDKGVELCTIQGLKQDLRGVTFSPDGARLVGVNDTGVVMVFDVSTGRALLTTRLRDFYIQSVRLSPDGKRLAVAGNAGRFRTGEVRVFAVDSGREVVPPLKGHTFVVRMVAFSPDGQRLATGGTDRTVKIWDLTTGQEILTLKGHTAMITSLHFVSEGRRLMSADMNGTVRVWDATPLPE